MVGLAEPLHPFSHTLTTILLFSPLGALIGFHISPPCGLSQGLFCFMAHHARRAVGWRAFHLRRVLRSASRRKNMMTLIALGILVSYTSVATTFLFECEVFYGVARFKTFGLAGHWRWKGRRSSPGAQVQSPLAKNSMYGAM